LQACRSRGLTMKKARSTEFPLKFSSSTARELQALARDPDIWLDLVLRSAQIVWLRERALTDPYAQEQLKGLVLPDERDDRGTKKSNREPHGPRLRNRSEVIRYARVLIGALEEALDFVPNARSNRPPPELWIDDDAYLRELKKLLEELRHLSSLLANTRHSKATGGSVINLAKHFDKFLSTYATAMGKIAAGLTGAAIVGLLYHAGITKETLDTIWGRLKFPR